MGRLVYSAIASLDGYIADADGKWDWSLPSTEVHAFVNDLMRPARTHLYGRRLYEVLVAWETMDDPAPEMQRLRAALARGRQGRLLDHARRRSPAPARGSSGPSSPTPCARSRSRATA